MDKPETLYRGIALDPQTFEKFSFHVIPMPKNAIYNEQGEKCVSDGQEYGLYMSDGDVMARQYAAFGRDANGGTIDNLNINYHTLSKPHIGILYEIDATQIDIRQPKLNVFKMHQAGTGTEWITDSAIPREAFEIAEVEISKDALHPAKKIAVEGRPFAFVRKEILKEIAEREEKLSKLAEILKPLPRHKRDSDFSPFSNNMDAIKILLGVAKQPETLEDLTKHLQVLNADMSQGFNSSVIWNIYSKNNINNTIQALSKATGIEIKSKQELAEMSPLRRFLYQKSIQNAKDYFMDNKNEIPEINTQKLNIGDEAR